jgi:hypothetical protein
MLRAPKYVDRPGHADVLHLDVWWRGQNILCDAGSYLYDGEPGWDNELISADIHNTVTVDAADPMLRAGLFLWLDWPEAKVQRPRIAGKNVLECVTAQHDGYAQYGVTHRRSVLRISDDAWIILDDVVGSGEHTAALHWLLPDSAPVPQTDHAAVSEGWRLDLYASAPATLDVVRAGEGVIGSTTHDRTKYRGWISTAYAQKVAAKSVRLSATASLPIRFITVLTFGKSKPRIDDGLMQGTGWTAELDSIGASEPIRAVMHQPSGARL